MGTLETGTVLRSWNQGVYEPLEPFRSFEVAVGKSHQTVSIFLGTMPVRPASWIACHIVSDMSRAPSARGSRHICSPPILDVSSTIFPGSFGSTWGELLTSAHRIDWGNILSPFIQQHIAGSRMDRVPPIADIKPVSRFDQPIFPVDKVNWKKLVHSRLDRSDYLPGPFRNIHRRCTVEIGRRIVRRLVPPHDFGQCAAIKRDAGFWAVRIRQPIFKIFHHRRRGKRITAPVDFRIMPANWFGIDCIDHQKPPNPLQTRQSCNSGCAIHIACAICLKHLARPANKSRPVSAAIPPRRRNQLNEMQPF